MSHRARGNRLDLQPSLGQFTSIRGVRFRTVKPIINRDVPDLGKLVDRLEAEPQAAPLLISRHRANPAGIGHALGYDVLLTHETFPSRAAYIYEPDHHLTDPDIPDVVIRDFSSLHNQTPKSWELTVWQASGNLASRAALSEVTPGTLSDAKLQALGIGIRMTINEVLETLN